MTSYLSELFSLTSRIAVVTGGNSGIGRAMAGALAGAGARVVVIARNEETLRTAVQDIGPERAAWVAADLGDRSSVSDAAERAAEVYGEPDILVNCAGVNIRPPLADLAPAQWDETLEVNLTAPFLLGQRYGPAMAGRGWGRIINIASQQAFRAFADSGAYGAAKGGLVALTRSQAEAWSSRGVCCNAISPGAVPTPMNRRLFADPGRAAALAARTMIGRNGVPEDFEGIAVFLASPASDYLTGQTIFLDGGFSVT